MKQTDLISDEMLEMNIKLHNDRHFGANSRKAAKYINAIVEKYNCKSALDYGCGKARLGKAVLKKHEDLSWRNYDPAREEFNTMPEPADVVIIRDVMEHVEPEKIDNVLKHIASLTKMIAWFVIPSGKSTKILADGQNAHLTQEQPDWWKKRLEKYFVVEEGKILHFRFICIPKEEE